MERYKEATHMQVQCDNLAKGLGRLLVKKWRWSPYKAAFVGWLWSFLSAFIVALFSGRFWPNPHYRSLLEDRWWWVTQFIVPPLVWGYFVWSLCEADNVLARLSQNGVVIFSTTIEKLRKEVYSEKLNNIGAIVFSVSYTLLSFYGGLKGPNGWWNASVFSLLFLAFPTLVGSYMAAYAIIRSWFNVRIFNKILPLTEYIPLHPDGAGGLSPLGEYALKILYPLAGGGSFAVFTEYWLYVHREVSTAYSFHIAILLYMVLTPLLFFMPLWAAHKLMKQKKKDLLCRVSKHFQSILLEIETQGNRNLLLEKIETIKELKEMQELINQFPVWPFNAKIFQKAIVSYLSPFFTLVASILTDVISKSLVK